MRPSSTKRTKALAPDLGLDLEDLADALQPLVHQRARQLVLALVDVPQLASCMGPARGLDDAAVFIELVVARERVGLQNSPPALEVACGVLALAVGRVLEPHRRRRPS
jgi:hypothetical protein